MKPITHTATSHGVNSLETGHQLGEKLLSDFGDTSPGAIILYASIEHDQRALLEGMRSATGPDIPVIGCSSQGMIARDLTAEEGYFAGAIAFGGSLRAGVAREDEIQIEPRAKGRALADRLLAQIAQPKLVVLHYDPLCKVNLDELLAGLNERITCRIVGGAASQPWGVMATTYQYAGTEVFSSGAVALALDGPFEAVLAASPGTEPIGIEHTVTRADGNWLLELDGRPALDVWVGTTGASVTASQLATFALGVAVPDAVELGGCRVLAPVGVNAETGAVCLSTCLPEGTLVTGHFRTIETVLEGSRAMSRAVVDRLAGREPFAVLAFECGARTMPFLGLEATLDENRAIQQAVAPNAEWIGMNAWGELLPLDSGAVVVNYTYSMICLVDE